MQTTETVFLATYNHKHGSDVRAFKTQDGADRWRREIADEWWDQEMPANAPKPEDSEARAAAYWAKMEENDRESFDVNAIDIED